MNSSIGVLESISKYILLTFLCNTSWKDLFGFYIINYYNSSNGWVMNYFTPIVSTLTIHSFSRGKSGKSLIFP